MRMWMIDPKKMCDRHLLGEHGEIHKFRHVFTKKHKIAGRFGQIEPAKMEERHNELAQEMLRRGMNHNSPYVQPDLSHLSKHDRFGTVNVSVSIADLCYRCTACRRLIT